MIDDELRPVVIEFVAEMLNDSHCESILLDVGEDAVVDSGLSVLYLDVTGKYCDYTLSIVGGEYSASIRNCGTDETMTTVKGREGAWGLQDMLGEIKTRLREES